MPDTPADPNLDLKQARKTDPGPRKNLAKPPEAPNWWSIWWYIPVMLLILWVWQDQLHQMSVKTIPYSQFKHYLAAGEVAECEIKDLEITGRVVPKEAQAQASTPATGKSEESKPAASSNKSSHLASPSKSSSGQEGKPALITTADSSKEKEAKPGSQTANDREVGGGKQQATEEATKKQEGVKPFLFRTERVEPDAQLVEQLEAANVTFSGVRPSFLSQFLYAWVLPIGVMVVLWMVLSRGLRTAGQSVMSFGKSRARLVADRDTGVTFDDVAGCDEAKYELQEVVDFLKNPSRYIALGAKIPKGVLLVGLPGTGKTLLSRAVAGEARVPFFSLSGSDFVEMFVGIGAARVRDLFEQAQRQAPCIIFIDELDAIGRERGVHLGPVNDEREQTLNQLLVEMDGFQANVGVILLAATNRPEVLDKALLRPGRFVRQVVIVSPDKNGREAILKVHCRGKPLADDVDLGKIAQGTPGFSGADLANAVNEAALLAARRRSKEITQTDMEEAVEKVVAGPERKSRRLDEQGKRRVAYHEVGHALVAAYSEHADPVHKISIVPRGRAALGYTLQLPTDDQFLLTRADLLDRMKGLLGGRASEELVFSEVSTGAEDDLEHATTLARSMVCLYGMGEAVGLVHCAQRPSMFLPGGDGTSQTDCSPQTAREIDTEVKKLLDTAYLDAKSILTRHRDKLEL
ncbi:MAG: ATP-dependent zinc metalloprotease FtsH, partial [Thermoguttaceae bacterium]